MNRMGQFLTILCLLAAAAPLRAAPPDIERGHAIAAGVCAACHGADGNSASNNFPKLAGQPAAYLVKQLHDFKPAGTRHNGGVMVGFAGALNDADMQAVADYYASQVMSPGAAHHPDTVALGRSIYRGGVAMRAVPACAGCHGPTGHGVPVLYPRLSGQWAEYTAEQLHAFQNGTRANSEPMRTIASRLSDTEIDALADYIAGLH